MNKSIVAIFALVLQVSVISTYAGDDVNSLKLLIAGEANDEALELFNLLISEDRDNAELWYLGSIVQSRLMRQDSALIYLINAKQVSPDNIKISTALSSLYAEMRRFGDAIDLMENLARKDSTLTGPFIQLASLYLRSGRPRVALDLYYYLHGLEPENYSFIKNIALCYRQTGNDMKAVSYYRRAHEIAPGDLSINSALASLYLKMKNYEQGLEIAESGLIIDTRNADLLFWSGFFNYAMGNYNTALTRLIMAEQEGNESINVIQYLGICYYLLGNYQMAVDYLEKAIEININSYRIYNYLGIIYRDQNDYEISEYYFKNSLSVLAPPVDALTETYKHLIETYKQAGEMEKAADAYRAALVYDNENPYLFYGLAYTLDNHLSDSEKALDSYIRFSEIASGMIDADKDIATFLDYSNSRIRRIREERFFGRE